MVEPPCGATIQVTLRVTQDIRNGPGIPRVNSGCECDISGQTCSWAHCAVIPPVQWRMWGHRLVGRWSLGARKDGAIKVGPDSRTTVLLDTGSTHLIPCSSDYFLTHSKLILPLNGSGFKRKKSLPAHLIFFKDTENERFHNLNIYVQKSTYCKFQKVNIDLI